MKFVKNKVIFYVLTRYVTYAVQFIVSLLIAARLGPYYMGIWGAVQMIIQYFRLVNFGIPLSAMVLDVQYKNNEEERRNFETTSTFLTGCLGLIPVIVCILYYAIHLDYFDKYELDNYFIYVSIIGIMVYFMDYFGKIFTVKGHFTDVAFSQSIIPFLLLAVLFVTTGKKLVYMLIGAYLLGYSSSIIIFSCRKCISLKGQVKRSIIQAILNKGFFLFIYNTSFYFILLVTKTFVSVNFSVEEFGYFAFAYTLSNAVLLLLEAFSSLITPKLIDKMNTDDTSVVLSTLKSIRVNYVCLAHGLMYIAILFFPVLLFFLPAYQPALKAINLIALTLILYTNSYGYIMLLMSKNKEKVLAKLSFTALALNVLLLYVLINVVYVPYQYAILATMISYIVFAYLCMWKGYLYIGIKRSFFSIMKECFHYELLIPYLTSIIVTVYDNYVFYIMPPLLFGLLNIKKFKEIFSFFIIVLKNPKIADVKNNN